MFQQHRTESTTLVRVLHEEGDLGRRRGEPRPGRWAVRTGLPRLPRRLLPGDALPVGEGHDLVSDQGDQRATDPLVNDGHPVDVGVGQGPARAEEAEVNAARRQAPPERPQPVSIRG